MKWSRWACGKKDKGDKKGGREENINRNGTKQEKNHLLCNAWNSALTTVNIIQLLLKTSHYKSFTWRSSTNIVAPRAFSKLVIDANTVRSWTLTTPSEIHTNVNKPLCFAYTTVWPRISPRFVQGQFLARSEITSDRRMESDKVRLYNSFTMPDYGSCQKIAGVSLASDQKGSEVCIWCTVGVINGNDISSCIFKDHET